MTGAGRLSSGPQPVMTSSACTLPLASRYLSSHDGLRSGRVKPQTPRQGWSPKGGKPGVGRGFSAADSPVPEGDAQPSDAQAALASINTAIASVAATRGQIGAVVNRLQSASNVISNQVTNLTSAENTINAADIPTAVANLTDHHQLQSRGE